MINFYVKVLKSDVNKLWKFCWRACSSYNDDIKLDDVLHVPRPIASRIFWGCRSDDIMYRGRGVRGLCRPWKLLKDAFHAFST